MAFAIAQWLTASYFSVPLTDIVAALVGALATVLVLRVWKPTESYSERDQVEAGDEPAGPAADGGAGSTRTAATDTNVPNTGVEIAKAYAPYLVIIALFSLFQIPALDELLAAEPWTVAFQWPGIDLVSATGADPAPFTFDWLPAAGTLMIFAGLITMPIIGIKPAKALSVYFAHLQAAGCRHRDRDGRPRARVRHEQLRSDRIPGQLAGSRRLGVRDPVPDPGLAR